MKGKKTLCETNPRGITLPLQTWLPERNGIPGKLLECTLLMTPANSESVSLGR